MDQRLIPSNSRRKPAQGGFVGCDESCFDHLSYFFAHQ